MVGPRRSFRKHSFQRRFWIYVGSHYYVGSHVLRGFPRSPADAGGKYPILDQKISSQLARWLHALTCVSRYRSLLVIRWLWAISGADDNLLSDEFCSCWRRRVIMVTLSSYSLYVACSCSNVSCSFSSIKSRMAWWCSLTSASQSSIFFISCGANNYSGVDNSALSSNLPTVSSMRVMEARTATLRFLAWERLRAFSSSMVSVQRKRNANFLVPYSSCSI